MEKTIQLKTGNRTRIGYIDALKGFAILCVVLGHVANGYRGESIYQNKILFDSIYNLLYMFHMPLFMLLSGYLFENAYFKGMKRDGNGGQKWQIANLVIIYFIYSALFIPLKMLFADSVNNHPTLKTLLMLPLKPYDIYWYLYTLLIMYLFFSINKIRTIPGYFMVPELLLINLVGGRLIPDSAWFQLKSASYYLIFFYMGILLSRDEKGILLRKGIIFALGFIAIIVSIIFWPEENFINEIWGINLIVGIGMSLLFFFMFEKIPLLGNCRILQFFGKHSLEVYIFHCYFIAILRTVDRRLNIHNPYLMVGMGFLAGALFPAIIAVLCKKWRLDKLFFRPACFFRDLYREKSVNLRKY